MLISDAAARSDNETDLQESVVEEVPLSEKSVTQTSTSQPGMELIYLASGFLGIAFIIVLMKRLQARKRIQSKLSLKKQTDQIPCTHCQYFNNNIYIKCAVQPSMVLSEQAKDCADYQPLVDNNSDSPKKIS